MLRFLVLVSGLILVTAVKLPSYISKCGRDDPEFNKCALASARAAKDHLVRGDRAFRVQPMDPLLVSRLRIEQPGSNGLNITFNDIIVSGMTTMELTDNFKLDPTKQSLSYEMLIPRFDIIGEYEMKGRILIVPIVGKGRVNITLSGLLMQVVVTYDVVKRDNGKEYLIFQEPKVPAARPKKAYFDLDNLFNGDPLLGPQTNRFLNENWMDISDDLGPSIAQGIATAIWQNLQGLFDKVPYDDLFSGTRSG